MPNTFIHKDDHRFSYFGDAHPQYSGSVVKALASSKAGYPHILEKITQNKYAAKRPLTDLMCDMHARIIKKEILADHIIELHIHAPLAAQNFEPGQFYKLQNYEVHCQTKQGIPLLMEPIAVTGSCIDKDKGIIQVILLQNGVSTQIASYLAVGEPVILMGPTGIPTTLPTNCKNLLIVGGGLGNAVLFSIAEKYRRTGVHVTYFAAYKSIDHLFKVDQVLASADKVIWSFENVDKKNALPEKINNDDVIHGTVIDALFQSKESLRQHEHMIVIGSDKMMHAVMAFRYHHAACYFSNHMTSIASVNAPMQCMMKGICGQCAQLIQDPDTGMERVVFTCQQQDQPLSHVQFGCLNQRLAQNSLNEKINKLWLETCLLGT